MKLIDITKYFKTEEDCLDCIEKMRWPDGEIGCVHCGLIGSVSRIQRRTAGKNKRTRLYECGSCKKQFSTTSGTIFQDSHLPLVKWFMAIALICEAKKGISALQLQRHIGGTYRTCWHLNHRIREAMRENSFQFLSGTVEVDETYLTPRKPRKGHPKPKEREEMVVLGMRQRGGPLRLIPVQTGRMEHIEPEMLRHISPDAMLQTDKAMTYDIIGRRRFVNHRMIDHIRTYGEGENHTNTVESAFSLLKKGVYGTFHKVSIKHLGRYCEEFTYRFNRRGQQLEMFGETVKHLTRGKALTYNKLTSDEEAA